MILFPMVLMGLLIALVSVFLGLGGGIFLVPLLPTLFDLTVHQAVATSVTTIFFVVCLNTYFFHLRSLVNWPVVLIMGPPSAVSAFFAARWAQWVDPRVILVALGLTLIAVALKNLRGVKEYEVHSSLTHKQKVLGVGGGLLGGLGSGFAGIGSGAILSPAMIVLQMVRPAQLSPTANGNMVFTTFGAMLSYSLATLGWAGEAPKDLVQWGGALGIFVFSQCFAFFLRPQQNRLPFSWKSTILNTLLLALAIKIGWMAITHA